MTNRFLITASLATLLAAIVPLPVARADIYQWEYINPANPSLGKQPSTTLTPGGAGANAVPGTNLSSLNLTKAYLIDANVSTYLFFNEYGNVDSYVASNLTAVNLSQADLANASFRGSYGYNVNEGFTLYPGADLTDANLIQANATNADFFRATLTGANLSQADLTNANLIVATLTNANLIQADLTNANLIGATLAGANLTGAEVRGADLGVTGITVAQLYSTASYQAHDLTGIGLYGNNLGGANLAGQNLTSASFHNTTLTSANLTGAEVRGAKFDRDSYYDGTGITAAQLYSTASYQAHDLSGIGLGLNDLAGVNFADQNLTSASFRGFFIDVDEAGVSTNLSGANFSGADARWADFYAAILSSANLSQANLQNANFSGDWNNNAFTDLANANLSGADARGANFLYTPLTGANTSNLIQSNGHILGLDLSAGASLVVRDYDGYSTPYLPTGPLPIVVDQHLAMDATSTLRLVFDADPWDSTISFAPGIPVARGGTLELTFAPGVNVASQSGRTIDLFDWTGVTPTGAFTISSPYTWNLTNLYTTGEVTLTAVPSLPGDFNHDGTVDAADYVVWRKNPGGIYTQNDFNLWRAHFGTSLGPGSDVAVPSAESRSTAVPEPDSALLLSSWAAVVALMRRRVASRVPSTR